MAPSFALTVAADGEHLSCGGISLGETVRFGSLEFITDYFDGLSLSLKRDSSDAAFMGSTYCEPLSPLRAMIGDSTEEFHTALGGERGSDLPSPRRHDAGALPTPATTISWSENTSTTQAMTTIPPRSAVPQSDTDFPFDQRRTHLEGGTSAS
jgi:hypothetical protein